MNPPPNSVLFFGHLHPALVHLPIGLVLLLAALELLARFRRFRAANANAGFILALAVPVAIGSAVCGWMLSLAGGYDAHLLQWHKWTGVGTAAACAGLALLYCLNLKRVYRWGLLGTTVLLAVASHFGGSLTHGSDYLVRYAPPGLRSLLGATAAAKPAAAKPKEVADQPAFATVVQPILQKDCAACHGPEKAKGGLRVDSFQALLKGSKSGVVVVPGKAAESELLKRVKLPVEDDDHMPPDGKPQPSAEDIALLQWWLDAGAPADKLVRDLKPSASITHILAARFGAPAKPAQPVALAAAPKPLSQALPLASKTADDLGVVITALSATEPWMQCNASIAGKSFGDAELAKLAVLGPNFRWLDLAGTAVTDAGLAHLSAFPNLVRLHLERTAVTDRALSNLGCLANLEYLDLYGTAVTDAGLDHLQTLPKLKHLYLWQTKVTPAAAKAFADARIDKVQVQQWQDEIEQIKAKIHDQQVTLDLGDSGKPSAKAATNSAAMSTMPSASATAQKPVNTVCPVSGKPVDPSKTVLQDGVLVGFCCNDCKAEFQKNPKPYLAKLKLPGKAKQ